MIQQGKPGVHRRIPLISEELGHIELKVDEFGVHGQPI